MSSSLFDGFHSDNIPTDLPHSTDRARSRRAPSNRPRSSSRPRGPPSESAGAPSDIDGLLDDDAIAVEDIRRRRGVLQRGEVGRVVDALGEGLATYFEVFLDT